MRTTLIVRALMYAHNKHTIYTNKYKHCRTVKCYVGNNDAELIKNITNVLAAAGVEFKVKIVEAQSSPDSLIVRLPLE